MTNTITKTFIFIGIISAIVAGLFFMTATQVDAQSSCGSCGGDSGNPGPGPGGSNEDGGNDGGDDPTPPTPPQDPATCDFFTGAPTTLPFGGGNVLLEWGTTNLEQVSISNLGTRSADGEETVFVGTDTTFVLSTPGNILFQGVDLCSVSIDVADAPVDPVCEDPAAENTGDPLPCEYPEPAPTCDFFTVTPGTITQGQTITLEWGTTNATVVGINNGIGAVDADGSIEVTPLVDTTYILTATNVDNETVTCEGSVVVETPTATSTPAIDIIKRDAADGDDTQTVTVGGTATFEIVVTNTGDEDLVNVAVTDVLEPACDRTIGNLAAGANYTYTCESTNVQSAFTNVADVTGESDVDGEIVTDTDPTDVLVPTPNDPELTCSDISISASNNGTSVTPGTTVTLNWVSTGNVDTVELDGTAVALTGSQAVTVNSATTYTFTINGQNDSENCAITINTATPPSGGGSSSPRCEFDISATQVDNGDEVTLTWETRRATDMTITDDLGNVIATTEGLLSNDKDELLDGSTTVTITRDTVFTLIAERGSRDRECEVEVEVDGDGVVVLEDRDQAPLVAGISLTQVPHTGFEAGPMMTTLFYVMIAAWALFLAYVFVAPKTAAATVQVERNHIAEAEAIRPDVFAPIAASAAVAPSNLPVAPVAAVATETVDSVALEAIAHANHALLSTDALATFMANVAQVEQQTKLVEVATAAKAQFPLEDGWVVINNDRMMALLAA